MKKKRKESRTDGAHLVFGAPFEPDCPLCQAFAVGLPVSPPLEEVVSLDLADAVIAPCMCPLCVSSPRRPEDN